MVVVGLLLVWVQLAILTGHGFTVVVVVGLLLGWVWLAVLNSRRTVEQRQNPLTLEELQGSKTGAP